MAKLVDIEGIGHSYATRLQEVDVTTQEKLLEIGATRKGRRHLVKKSGISGKLILSWLNRADLARVKGIGEEYADLLEVAGVDTVPALARRNPINLHARMCTINEQKKLVRSVPSEKQVRSWVEAARELPRVIHY